MAAFDTLQVAKAMVERENASGNRADQIDRELTAPRIKRYIVCVLILLLSWVARCDSITVRAWAPSWVSAN